MNLRNGQITIGELLQNPQARAAIQQQVPQLAGMLSSPLARGCWNMTLHAAAVQARRYLPAGRVQALLDCLKNI